MPQNILITSKRSNLKLKTRPKQLLGSLWGQCYKTFYVRSLRMFVISQSVCPWKTFPVQSNVILPTSGAPLRCSIWESCGLYRKHQARLERLENVKHSSLLRTFDTYRLTDSLVLLYLCRIGLGCQGMYYCHCHRCVVRFRDKTSLI